MKQNTIQTEAFVTGKGIHSGKPAYVKFLSAQANNGIYFIRTDLKNSPPIPALWKNVCDTGRATTLGLGEVRVRTVEHVLSAIFGLGITNLRIELNNEEVPILDGSSKVYYDILKSSGLKELPGETNCYTIQKEMVFKSPRNNSLIRISPNNEFQITYHLNYAEKFKQNLTYLFSQNTYYSQIAPARTYALLSELEYLLEKGLISGISDAEGFAVVDDFSKIDELAKKFSLNMDSFLHTNGDLTIISKEKHRFPDEMVRHKLLDIIGDFALSGYHIRGRIEAFGTGHSENIGLIKAIFG
ncbi:UDP-3-O-[3-hydroxymyristoyl] N-acetylglucosamine deacetylase [bacterium]|nr:UDP-3-O-[3-hydroxymyristoyl] N-acetylglucosamine deacetylase [bacterium]